MPHLQIRKQPIKPIKQTPNPLGIRLLGIGIASILAACSNMGSQYSVISATSSAISTTSANEPQAITSFVVLGENGTRIARTLVKGNTCPLISLDNNVKRRMEMRAAAGTVALRATRFSLADSKPSVFPLSTCEKVLPATVQRASINGQPLPLKAAPYHRIVVIGDTGCRLSKFANTYQACHDPSQSPFARIATLAANWKPDLVIHVGDYHYRENRCPPGNAGCAGSPWGYGYDAWREDFFKPADALLRAAPWVMVRGNHELCSRAGQGWWRLLDPRPLSPGRDCNHAANDTHGDYSDPYAVPIDQHTQLIVGDSSNTVDKAIPPTDIRFEKYQDLYTKLVELASRADHNIVLFHHPILGLASDPRGANYPPLRLNLGIQSVFQTLNPHLFPANVDVILAGHYHSWEQISFSTPHPTQFVIGISGTQPDAPLSEAVLNFFLKKESGNESKSLAITPAPGAVVENISAWATQHKLGYMTMEYNGPGAWHVNVWDQTGQPVKTCQVVGKKSVCNMAEPIANSQ